MSSEYFHRHWLTAPRRRRLRVPGGAMVVMNVLVVGILLADAIASRHATAMKEPGTVSALVVINRDSVGGI